MKKKITKEVEVYAPTMPNFIKVGNDAVPVEDFTKKELLKIGKEWLEKLVARGKSK